MKLIHALNSGSNTTSLMDSDIDTKLLKLMENDLLAANVSTIGEFNNRWRTLIDGFTATVATQPLSVSALKSAYFVVNRVSQVAQVFLDLEVLTEKIAKTLLEETSSSLDPPTSGALVLPPVSTARTAILPHIKPAYTWLLNNLHNPYPSTRLRDSIAQQSGVLRKDIDRWFSNARTHIGWNSTRKEFFSDRRVEIVDAATRFFANADHKCPIDPEIKRQFAAIEKGAKNLLNDSLLEGGQATRLVIDNKKLLSQETQPPEPPQRQPDQDSNAYPSPEHTPTLSLPNLCRHDSASSDSIPTIPIIGHKRLSPSADAPQTLQDVDSIGHRPKKRLRLSTPTTSQVIINLPTGLPSPAPSLDELQHLPEALTPLPNTQAPALYTRKRRLSDSFGERPPKRPRSLPVGPRAQAVSDPLPSYFVPSDTPAFDDWFQPSIDINPPLDVEEVNPYYLDVHWATLPDLDFSEGSPQAIQQPFELPPIEPNFITKRKKPTSQPLDYGELQSLLFDNSIVNIAEHAPDLSNLEQPFEVDFIDDVDDPLLCRTAATSFDPTWDLLDFTGMGLQVGAFDPAQPLDKISHDLESCLTSDDDHSRLQSQAARAEKEKRLREVQAVRVENEKRLQQMQEEERRLELELLATA